MSDNEIEPGKPLQFFLPERGKYLEIMLRLLERHVLQTGLTPKAVYMHPIDFKKIIPFQDIYTDDISIPVLFKYIPNGHYSVTSDRYCPLGHIYMSVEGGEVFCADDIGIYLLTNKGVEYLQVDTSPCTDTFTFEIKTQDTNLYTGETKCL